MILLPRFIRSSIQSKLFISFLGVLLLLVAVVAASFIIISSLGKASDKILKMNYNSIIASINMQDDLETIQREYIILTARSGEYDSRKMLDAQTSFSQWLGRAKDNVTEKGEESALAGIDTLYSAYLGIIQKTMSSPADADKLIAASEVKRFNIQRYCRQLLKINQNAMFRRSNAAQNIARNGTGYLVLITVLVMVMGVVLSWGLSRRIVRPIVRLKEATQRLARGDYSIDLASESEDELGILTSEFDEMANKLQAFNDLSLRTIVTEQKKTGAILANIQDGIFFIGTDFIIRDVNTAALEAFKLSRDEVVGHHYLEIIKQDKLFADLRKCLETQQIVAYSGQENILTIRKNEHQIYLEYFFSPVMSDKKELLGALYLLRDITKLMELDRLKSEFVMIASHELKTPLTSINMSIDLLRESLGESPKDKDLELINIAKEEINRLRLLISDLLDLSKIEAGRIEMHFGSVAPCAVMEAVAQYFKNQLADRDTALEINCPAKINNIWCDEEKLMLVFSNLVSNALKAVTPGKGRISLTAEASGKFILFGVRDNGLGIPLSHQNKIFDRFVQVEDQNAARGTGLGLTISREIVRAHGGTIWVESSPGNGADFYFTIPTEPLPLEQIITR
jgi:two-component system, NtrC family, sensor histidine kinase KinB